MSTPSIMDDIRYNMDDIRDNINSRLTAIDYLTGPSYYERIGEELGWSTTSPVEALLHPWAQTWLKIICF